MNTVSTLVQESKEVSNQIKGMRQHQKSIADEKLKKKLQAKKNKKVNDSKLSLQKYYRCKGILIGVDLKY